MSRFLIATLIIAAFLLVAEGGIIKDLFQKVTHTNNKTEDLVKESAPVCGSGIFSTPNEGALSPEFIFITNRQSKSQQVNNGDHGDRESERSREVAREFSFHAENVTLEELERNGFNRDSPVTFLMHGFTSGYPLQAWISAIVEAYTIDRETSTNDSGSQWQSHGDSNQGHSNNQQEEYRRDPGRNINNEGSDRTGKRVNHNLFIINWNYAARGIVYPRAVANIPIVASYATRFINDKLLGEARIDPRRIQLIGHSLGAHLAGFIGKNTRSKLGRIYGLDPAGPCFGTLSGPLYPSSKRLAPSDAEEVITVQTNTALLGIDKPLGKYSVFVEGGSVQPGCKGGGVLASLGVLTWDGGDFDTLACSHSRAPNLLIYRHDQTDSQDDCQLVAYECKDWDSFTAGHCGICHSESTSSDQVRSSAGSSPLEPVDCLRVGLNWQYPGARGGSTSSSNGHNNEQNSGWQRPTSTNGGFSSTSGSAYNKTQSNNSYNQEDTNQGYQQGRTSTVRPENGNYGGVYSTTSGYSQTNGNYGGHENHGNHGNGHNDNESYGSANERRSSTISPNGGVGFNSNIQRDRRETGNATSDDQSTERRDRFASETSTKAKSMFLRTSNTQPYCTYHYQVILELNEPFEKKKPGMSLVLQDSESGRERGDRKPAKYEQNSLANDEFGNKFNDRIYTSLMTSGKKLKRIDHATLLIRDGLPDGFRLLKAMHVNYMSHNDKNVRRNLSSRLCPVRTETDRDRDFAAGKRFYFEPCESRPSSSSTSAGGMAQTGGRQRQNKQSRNRNQTTIAPTWPLWH